MKAKKLLALTLALILALSCMSITAFAAATAFEKDFLLNIPHLTVGTTAEQLKSGITFADATIGNDIELIDAVFYNSAQDSKGTVAAPEHDRIFITFQVKNTTDYNNFGGKTLQGLPFKSYNAEVTFKDGNTDLTNVGTIIGNSFDTTTHEVGNSGNGDNIYCQVRCAVTVYDGTAILDLEDSDTYPDTKSGIEQTYTATVYEPKTDKTKVQVSWKLEDIAATVTQNKIWNTETLTWDNDGAATAVASPVTAEFDFVNLSSERVKGKVDFTASGDFNPTVDYSDKVVALLSKADDKDCDNKAKITVTLTPDEDDFTSLTANTNGTYGTYTVSIAEPEYLTFTATAAGSSVTPNFANGSWEYSTDNGSTWTAGTNDGNTAIALAQVNDFVELRGDGCTTGFDEQENPHFFSMSGKIAASGDVTSITNGVGGDAQLTEHCYMGMFAMCDALTTAPALPSTTLTPNCYQMMFYYCTSLTDAPTLPATELDEYCYDEMFFNCTSLTVAPVLPATEMADYCYGAMLGATAITVAPELPATKLAEGCYTSLFIACVLLEEAPELPATELKKSCYSEMFQACQKLTEVPNLPATTLAEKCYYYMFNGCVSLKISQGTPESCATKGEIFTCPSGELPNMAVYNMFVNIPDAPTISGGNTYYWYTVE